MVSFLELAFVLSHEVSHLVLGHVSQANRMQTMLRTVEVLLLSIDPTSGVLALFFIGGLAALREALTAAHSRENEREADDLGVEIAARACFDTVAGAEVMKKMYHMSTLQIPSPSGQKAVAHLYDSHPPSQERYERLLVKAEDHNKHHFSHCHGFVKRFFTYMWDKPEKHMPVEDAMEQVANKKGSD
jgi:Zn-dependent protease with chaperone function